MSNENLKHFETLNKINVSDKIDKKGKFNYLSWSYAVEEMTKACPEWTYEIEHFNNLPYVYDEKTGYMVFTNITAFGYIEQWKLSGCPSEEEYKESVNTNLEEDDGADYFYESARDDQMCE